MILFHAKRDGTVTTTPNLVPQGSSMQDLVVVSEFDYAYCAIQLLPASGEYIEDIPCTPILQKDYTTIWTASLPPKATVVAGSVDYQLIFTAADGATQTTLVGSFTVPRGVPVSTPGSVEELSVKTIGDLYTIMANTYGLFVGHERDIYQSLADIAALKKTVSSAGYVTIPVTQWEDGTPTIATFTLDGFGAGMTAMLIPADSNTQTAAREARLSAYPVAFPIDSDTQTVEIIRADADKAPEIPLRFAYLILKTDTSVAPAVAILGVDAYGEGGGGAASGVDEGAVKKIINSLLGNVDNVRQYSADNPPPYPVTSVNGEIGAVNLPIPSEASDVGADPAGTAESKTTALRDEVNGKLADYDKSTAVNKKIGDHNVSTASHEDIRLDLQRLADRLNAALNSTDTSLDDLKEIVAYIKANKTLIDGITSSKVNVTDIVNNLTTNTANVPLSAAQGVALRLLIESLEDVVEGKITPDQVAAQIKAALDPYITKDAADKTYQPAGDYLTPTTGDQRYAKPTDIPTVPTKLPNPNALTINGKTYDGSSPVELTIEGGGSDADLAEEVARMKEMQPNLFVDAVQTGNLLDKTLVNKAGYYVNSSGGFTALATATATEEYIDISKAEGTHLAVYACHNTLTATSYWRAVYRMCFYNADKVKIGYHDGGGATDYASRCIMTIPEGAVYVRVSFTSGTNVDNYVIRRGPADMELPYWTPYEPVREAVVVPEDLNQQLDKVRSAGRDQHQDNAVLTVTKLNNSATFSENGITFVGDELWVMKDDASYTNGTRIHRYHVDDETFTYLGYIDGDFGHLNTMDYCAANDCFIFGNGGNDQSTEGNYFVVVKHPLTIPYNTTTTIAELVAAGQAIKYDLDSTIGSIGYKVQALWGDSNLGSNNRVILLANDTRSIREVLLTKIDGEFDGGLTVLRSFTFENDDSFGIQDADIWGDTLYIGGQGTVGNPGRYLICKVSLTDPSKREIIARDFYMDDGTALTGCVQGVYVDHDYIWIATNAPSTQSPQVAITKYRR